MDVKAARQPDSQREKDRVKGTGDSQSMLVNLSQINLLSAVSCLTLTHIFIHRNTCFLHNKRHRHGWVTFTFKEPLFSKREHVKDELHRKVTPTRLWCKDWKKKKWPQCHSSELMTWSGWHKLQHVNVPQFCIMCVTGWTLCGTEARVNDIKEVEPFKQTPIETLQYLFFEVHFFFFWGYCWNLSQSVSLQKTRENIHEDRTEEDVTISVKKS